MTLYEIETPYDTTYVLAENYAEAERIHSDKYGPTKIKKIENITDYVQVQQFDEQSKKES